MTYCSTFIAELTPDFELAMGGWGHLPKSIGPYVPNQQHYNGDLRAWAEAKGKESIAIDPDAWLVVVTPDEILDFANFLEHRVAAWYKEKIQDLKAFCGTLDPNGKYGIVGECW